MIHADAAIPTRQTPVWSDAVWGLALGLAGVVVIALSVPRFVAVAAVPLLAAGVLAVIDQRTTRIATRHAIALLLVTVISVGVGIAVDRGSWGAVLAGAALWLVPLFVLAVAGGFGGGDFKFGASLGVVTGWISLSCAISGLLLAFVAAGVAGIALAVRQHTTRAAVPLGVPLFIGAVAAIALQAIAG